MRPTDDPTDDPARAFLASLAPLVRREPISRSLLASIGRRLVRAAPALERSYASSAIAPALEPLAEDGIALYLVADPVGDVSPPHVHDTWSVSLLLAGRQEHELYVRDAASGVFRRDRTVLVEPGRVLAMMPEEAHGVRVVGDEPTLELHLYGMALERLRSFEARCLRPQRQVPLVT